MDLRVNTINNTCDMCNSTIYEITARQQYKLCASCNITRKCKCCDIKKADDIYYPYCINCYSGLLRLSIIVPEHIYISDYYTAQNYELLAYCGIKQILTIGKELPAHNTPKFETMYISLDDHPNEDISTHFTKANEFIHKAPTLIHCYAGVSRSVSLVLSYLITHLNMTLDEALTYCKQRRPHINPNYGFLQQLKKYEKEIKE